MCAWLSMASWVLLHRLRLAAQYAWDQYLWCTHVKVVDGAQSVVLNVPAKCRHAAAHIQPRHHDACDELISNVIAQH